MKELAKLIREHRRCRAVDPRYTRTHGYECVCGAPLKSNSMVATSEHLAEVILAWAEE